MSSDQTKAAEQRLGKLHTSKSFTRFEPQSSPLRSPRRSRASTLANEVLPESHISPPPSDPSSTSTDSNPPRNDASNDAASSTTAATSVFEKPADDSDTETTADRQVTSPLDNLPPDFDSLPIEIASWADRFVTDLTNAKVFSQPPNIDTLAEIFQDFYTKAQERIGTHIQTLATRQSRADAAAANVARRPRPMPRLGSGASREEMQRSYTAGSEQGTGQPMLTPGEVHEKRRAKRLLEYKRVLLEEAIERRVTEALYEKLWRHKSSLDEVRDDKLRGKTGSLQLIGIGLKELGVDLNSGGSVDTGEQTTAERAVMIEEWISKAAEGLLKMNEASHPKGKLDELIAAHQRIVDLLTKVHRGSSSADEILPTLIYTLIMCPAEGLNVISNMNFVQRFRAASKMNGEAAYCLTNLEAAITFLETVDLAHLRSEEAIVSTPTTLTPNQPVTPLASAFNTQSGGATGSSTTSATDVNVQAEKGTLSKDSGTASLPAANSSSLRTSSHHRRLSSLMSFPSAAFNTANDAVRNTADQSIRSVSATLDNSFKLLFGRLREQQAAQSNDDGHKVTSPVVVPKTLDEARRLVTPKIGFEDDGASENSLLQDADDAHPLKQADDEKQDDKVLGLIAGKGKAMSMTKTRDRSVDSKASDASSTRAGKQMGAGASPATTPGAGAFDNAAEAFRTFGNNFNPLSRLGNTSFMSMRGFGRTSTPPGLDSSVPPPAREQELRDGMKVSTTSTVVDGQQKGAATEKLAPPPRQQFVDTKNVTDLRVGDLQELLNEYHRLVNYLKRNGLT